jgi:hypothetical protein
MVWINRTLKENQKYIFPCNYESELIEKFLERAWKWQIANPDAIVSIWYDSRFSSREAISSTQGVMDKYPQFSKVTLKDIREVEIVKLNADSFSDMVPVYVRVDLVKLILCVHSIEKEGMDSSSFSDMDIGEKRADKGRMNKEQLYNPDVMRKLLSFGFEVGSDGAKPENQFIQLWKKPEALIAFKLTIDATFLRIVTVLNFAHRKNQEDVNFLKHLNSGTVFVPLVRQTVNLLYGLIATEDKNTIKVNLQAFNYSSAEEWLLYDPQQHGCIPLGNFYMGDRGGDLLNLYEVDGEVKCGRPPIELPEAYPEIIMGRNDMHTKGGSAHPVIISDLVDRKPENGDIYQFTLMLPPAILKESEHQTKLGL